MKARCLGGFLLVLTLLTGCGRSEHADGDGPLSAYSGVGGFTMDPPRDRQAPWYGAFGAHLPCTTEPGVRIELQRLTWRAPNAHEQPVSVEPILRTYPQGDGARSIGVDVGWPEEGDGVTIRRGIKGAEVTRSCDEVHARGEWKLPEVTELVFMVKAGCGPVRITHFYLDYLADGSEYRLVLDELTVMHSVDYQAKVKRCEVRGESAGR